MFYVQTVLFPSCCSSRSTTGIFDTGDGDHGKNVPKLDEVYKALGLQLAPERVVGVGFGGLTTF